MANKALPSFEQARAFAKLIGIVSAETWEKYIAGKSRTELLEQVLSIINGRVIQVAEA